MSDDLAALEAEAAAVDAEIAPAAQVEQPAEAAPPVADEVAELSALISIVSGLFAPVFPSLAKIYTPDTVQSLAQAAVPVMRKHGWSTSALLGRYAEELALLAVVAPVGMATWQGIKADVAAAEKEKQAGGFHGNLRIRIP